MVPPTRRLVSVFGLTCAAAALAFGVGAPPEHCPDVTVAELGTAAASATGWIVDNQQPDGRWLYEYDRTADRASDDYNIVRHAGVMSSLYQAAARGVGDGALASADRGLAWALDHVVERDGWAGVTTGGTVQAGTNALLLAALVERRELTGDDSYDELMHGLATFLAGQTEPSGAVLAYYDLEPGAPRADVYSIYYTGEAYWALGRMHRLDPEAGWGAVADRIGHYVATTRDVAEGTWPPLADHWSGYALAETAAFPEREPRRPLTDDEITYLRRQGGLIGQRVRSISQRFGPWGPLVRGTFTPRGGGYGVFGEGLTGLWRAAQLDDRLVAERGDLADRARCIAGLAVEAQTTSTEAAAYDAPGRVAGAWFIDDVTRMDDQQHALSALLLTAPLVEAMPYDAGHPAPSLWLWIVVVVGVVNPLRAWVTLPSASSSEGVDRRRSLVAGVVAGSVLLLVVGALSGPLLSALGVSRPAMRLAAGALCLLAAAVDLVRRPLPPDDGAVGGSSFEAALLAVARPALVVAGLSVVADHGLLGYAAALALAVAPIAAVVVARPTWAGTMVSWGARLLSAGAIAAAVLLIVDAVFAV